MFSDIILETQKVTNPDFIRESIGELRFEQLRLFREASSSFVVANLSLGVSGDPFLLEASMEDQRKSLLKRLVESFKKLIAKIIAYLDKKFNFTFKRINRLTKLLYKYEGEKKSTYKDIEIEVNSNINEYDSVLRDLSKASGELKEFKLNEIVNTIQKMRFDKKILTGIQILKGTYMTGYVPVLSKYDGKDIEKIKQEALGPKKIMKGIRVDKFVTYVRDAQKFRDEMKQFANEYGKTLSNLNLALSVTDKTNKLEANTQHLFSKAASAITAFFNRNIDVILKLTIAIMDSTISTATRMARKVGLISGGDKDDE